MMPSRVRIVEVGPRDGLQNEAAIVPVDAKVALIEALAGAGLTSIEAGSFVSPKWVPQMATTADVLARLRPRPGAVYSVLVPNLQGLAAAKASAVTEISVFAAASESFSRRNINCSIGESLERLDAVAKAALVHGMRVRGYVSCVLGCPFEGEVSLRTVAEVVRALTAMGCYEVSLGDTIGVGTPAKARHMVEHVARDVPVTRLALHFHDTYGQALANILACLETGASVVDSAVAGLGGCPYAPGATGNVATEEVVYMLDGMGMETGVDLGRLCAAGDAIFGRTREAERVEGREGAEVNRDPAPSLRLMAPINTPRLRLRLLQVSDAAAFRTMTDDPAITDKIHFLSHPFTIEDAERLIFGDDDGRDGFWGVWAGDPLAMIGTVGSNLRGLDEIEIGYWFAGASHGRGFGMEAVDAVVQA